MKKLLFVDVPFLGQRGGDKNRSQFLWSTLSKHYEAKLVLTQSNHKEPLSYSQKRFSLRPYSIYQFPISEKKKFREMIREEYFDVIFFRYASQYDLIKTAIKFSPLSKVVVDVDMLFSRIAELSWNKNKSLKNKFYLFELIKLKWFEKKLFNLPVQFYLTNKDELELVRKRYVDKSTIQIMPNVALCPEGNKKERIASERFILFYGSLNSSVNEDAIEYIANELYEGLESALISKGIKIYIVGRSISNRLKELLSPLRQVRLIGEVDNLLAYIKSCEFVFLPLRYGSGTRTRILEAATLSKAVLTTTVGMEGLVFDDSNSSICDTPQGLINQCIKLMDDKTLVDKLGEGAFELCEKIYSKSSIENRLIKGLSEIKSSKKLGMITNRFLPQIGGAEINIDLQARHLSDHFNVTVLTPKRDNSLSIEERGIKIIRFKDVLNKNKKSVNLNGKTLCLGLLLHLLTNRYDVLMLFPSLNYNNQIAIILAKMLNIPVVLCLFDYFDYAQRIKQEKVIPKNFFENHSPKLRSRWLLKAVNQIFTISLHELDFVKKFNTHADFSPVPVLQEEYTHLNRLTTRLNLAKTDFIFLVLGRVSYIKGQDIALKAFKMFCEKVPKSKLIIMGRTDFEKQYVEDLNKYIEDNDLKESVILTGGVNRKEVLYWLNKADVHIVPVRFMNSGAIIYETWISQTIVIQSDRVDPNFIKESMNGYSFKSENVESLCEKMRMAYENRDNINQMALNGKRLVEKKFTYPYLTNLYLQKMNQII